LSTRIEKDEGSVCSFDPSSRQISGRHYLNAKSYALEKQINGLNADAQRAKDEANSKIDELMKNNADRYFMFRAYRIVSTTELATVVCLAFICIRLWKRMRITFVLAKTSP